jgi:hypothetical protein
MIGLLDNINWKNMKSLKCIKSGPSGIFFAGFDQVHPTKGTAIVIKSCPEPVNSFYTNQVMQDMHMFKVPKMKVIHHKMKEYQEMMFALDKASLGEDQLRREVRSNINRPFILIMEYIQGFSLDRVLLERSHMIFHPDSHNRDTSLAIGYSYDTKVPKTPEEGTRREYQTYENNKQII